MSTPDGYIVIMQHLAELRSRLARERRDDDADVVVQAMTSISSMELHRQMYENKRAPASGEPSGAEAVVREAYNEGVVVAYDNVADSLRALIANGRRVTKRDVLGVIEGVERAASQIAPYAGRLPTAPGAPEEGAGDAE